MEASSSTLLLISQTVLYSNPINGFLLHHAKEMRTKRHEKTERQLEMIIPVEQLERVHLDSIPKDDKLRKCKVSWSAFWGRKFQECRGKGPDSDSRQD